jgi:hypothetical protein
MAISPLRTIDLPTAFAPLKDLQQSLQEHEQLPDKTPWEEMAIRLLKENIAQHPETKASAHPASQAQEPARPPAT